MSEDREPRQSDDATEALALEALGVSPSEILHPRRPLGADTIAGLLFVVLVGVRLVALDQPIVENYVGRQIPTAMVAREMERGSGFLHPRLQTGPFPNYFLVEAPLYQAHVLAVRLVTRLPVDQAGRVVSALAIGIGGLCLYAIVRRQRDARTGLVAMVALGILPVTLRYGRSVQPDAIAMADVLIGFLGWQTWTRNGRPSAAMCGWTFLALGLAEKALWVFALLPMAMMLYPRLRHARARTTSLALLLVIMASELVPAGAWYAWAAGLLKQGAASSQVTAGAWLAAIWPPGLLRFETWDWITKFGVIRAFSPLALLMALRAFYVDVVERMWTAWFLAGLTMLLLVSGKLHHEYYWMLLAPAVAVGVASQVGRFWELAEVEGRKPVEAFSLLALQMMLCVVLSWSTWSTPAEWREIRDVGNRVATLVPRDVPAIAREAVLFYADRRGYRLETEEASAARALAEIGEEPGGSDNSLKRLLMVYRERGARYLAETGFDDTTAASAALPGVLEEMKAQVLLARRGVLVVRLPSKD